LLVGPGDDAGIFIHNGVAVIETVDIIAPVVDDPFTFGAISAANAVSDVYAMGGSPITALAIAGFPLCSCPPAVLTDIIRGAVDILQQAGAVLTGGHSFDNNEIKFGLSVTGVGDPRQILHSSKAQPGDILVLTKPIGVGMITTALKGGKAFDTEINEAVRWMLTLNKDASTLAIKAGAHACTDVTGFGLLGHAYTMVRKQLIDFEVDFHNIPILPAAWRCLDAGMAPEGAYKNLQYLKDHVHFAPQLSDDQKLMLCDPQTSGGLLMALPKEKVSAFATHGIFHAVIGKVVTGQGDIQVNP
jgi:selenide,water dikinase